MSEVGLADEKESYVFSEKCVNERERYGRGCLFCLYCMGIKGQGLDVNDREESKQALGI